MKRAVLYARVSSDDRGKDGRNLAGQLDMGREYAHAHGWEILAELAEDDRGASGASFDLPQLNRAREMARNHEFDVLVVREVDRLSRNLAKQLIVEEELKRCGVEIAYVLGEYPDTPEGNFMKNVRATVAEYEREKIRERMTRGRRLKVKGGSVMVHGRPPYGYELIDRDGKQLLEVYEPEARIVRLVYTLYVEGNGQGGPMTINDITRKLSDMRVPTFSDTGTRASNGEKHREYGQWNRTSVSKMLKNETYAGVWRYGKRGTDGTLNDDDYLIPVEVQNIIDRQTWEAAQARRVHNRQYARRNLKHKYLLSKRVTCGTCTCKMAGTAVSDRGKLYLYYRCPVVNRHLDFTRTCDMPYIRADQVDARVWIWVRELLLNPKATLKGLEQEQANREQINRPLRNRLAVLDDLLAEHQGQLERALDLYLAGDFPREMLTERRKRLETTIYALSNERAALVAQLEAQTITDEQIQSIMAFTAKMGEGLEEAEKDFEKRRQLIDALDLRATLAIEDGKKVVHVSCKAGKGSLSIVSTSSYIDKHNTQDHFIITARLVLDCTPA